MVENTWCENRLEEDFITGNGSIDSCKNRCESINQCTGVNYYENHQTEPRCYILNEDVCTEKVSNFGGYYQLIVSCVEVPGRRNLNEANSASKKYKTAVQKEVRPISRLLL